MVSIPVWHEFESHVQGTGTGVRCYSDGRGSQLQDLYYWMRRNRIIQIHQAVFLAYPQGYTSMISQPEAVRGTGLQSIRVRQCIPLPTPPQTIRGSDEAFRCARYISFFPQLRGQLTWTQRF